MLNFILKLKLQINSKSDCIDNWNVSIFDNFLNIFVSLITCFRNFSKNLVIEVKLILKIEFYVIIHKIIVIFTQIVLNSKCIKNTIKKFTYISNNFKKYLHSVQKLKSSNTSLTSIYTINKTTNKKFSFSLSSHTK